MQFEEREAPTRAKHRILQEYTGAWSSIISNGVRGTVYSPTPPHKLTLDLVYFDGFAGPGCYKRDADKPDQEGPVWGSPIIAARALKKVAQKKATDRLKIRLTVILIEKKGSAYQQLLRNLKQAQLGFPLVPSDGFSLNHLGDIVAIQGDFRDHVEEVVTTLNPEQFLLAFIDPFGPSAPLEQVARVVGRERTDSLIFFPSHQVDLRGGSVRKPFYDRRPQERENIRRIDRLFGTERWREIARKEHLSVTEREDEYAELYRHQLQEVDPQLIVKSIGLRFSTMDRPFYQLVLTTRDPYGAFRMNEILHETELEKKWMRWKDRRARIKQEKEQQGVLELGLEVPKTKRSDPEIDEPSAEEVREKIQDCLPEKGSCCTYRDILQQLADTPYRRSSVNRALGVLKRQGTIEYSELQKDEVIQVKRSR